MKKRSVACLLAIMMAIQSFGSINDFGYSRIQAASKSQILEQAVSTPTPLPVTIGKKVPDSAISTDGISTLANSTTVATKKQFMRKLHDYMNARKKSFTIVFKGNYQKIYTGDIEAMFSQAWGIDDKSTSDDFDYLLGNIDTYRFKVPTYSQNKSIFQFTIKYRESAAQLKKVNKKVKSALEELDLSGKSRAEKARLIHNYIAEHMVYDKSLSRFSAYDGLVRSDHSTVCQGYALLYYKMCTEVGIPCRFVSGHGYTNGRAVPHAWNIVKIGSKWYHVDTTWDDTDGVLRNYVYDYFLIGSTKMMEDHTLDPEFKTSSFKKKYPIDTKNYAWSIPNSTPQPIVTKQPVATGKVTAAPKVTNLPHVTAAPKATSPITASPVVSASPVVTKGPEATSTPSSTTITRWGYYQYVERSYKNVWKYDTATELKKLIYDCYLNSLYDVFMELPEQKYTTLAREYAENIQMNAEDKLQNGSLPYLKSFLAAFAEEWDSYMTQPMNAYLQSDAYRLDLNTYKKMYPALSEEEVELQLKTAQYQMHYNSNKQQLKSVVLKDAENIL